jgi:Proteins of 100 residues with WXG
MAISPSQAAEVAYILSSPTHTDYDHAGETWASPAGLHSTGQQINDLAKDISDSVDRIQNTLQSLVLNDWQGATQQEADDFNNRWLAVMGELFGSKDKPNDGVLNAMADGIFKVTDNYNKAETGLVNVWSQFAGKLPSEGQKADSTPSDRIPPDEMDTNATAITADYPGN